MIAEQEISDSLSGSEDQFANGPEKMNVATNICHYFDQDDGIQNVPFALETEVQPTVTLDDISVQEQQQLKMQAQKHPKLYIGLVL